MDVSIYHSQTHSLLRRNRLHDLIQQLPESLRSKALRYRSEVSAYNYVIGRLLLKTGLEHFDLDSNLEHVSIQENGKPILSGIHFNISHSEDQVLCAFSKNGQLGIDLEQIKPIDFEDFTHMFTPREWESIKNAFDPLKTFYQFWTRKESIIKALGRPLSYLHKIELDASAEQIEVDQEKWHLTEVKIQETFCCAICSEEQINKLVTQEIFF